MTRAQLTVSASTAGVLLFIVGLAATFPVERIGERAGRTLERSTGLPITTSPLRATWSGLAADRVDVRTSTGMLSLHDLRVPWSWRMLTGVLLRAGIGPTGTIELRASRSGDMALSIENVMLQDLPLNLPAEARLTGRIDGTAKLIGAGEASAPGEPAAGQVTIKAQGIEVRNVKLAGSALPPLRLDTAECHANVERRAGGMMTGPLQASAVQVDSCSCQGDVQGNLTGTISPNPSRPEESRLNLTLKLTVQRTWINQLGDLRAVAEGFLPGGQLEGVVQGTLAAPTFTPTLRH